MKEKTKLYIRPIVIFIAVAVAIVGLTFGYLSVRNTNKLAEQAKLQGESNREDIIALAKQQRRDNLAMQKLNKCDYLIPDEESTLENLYQCIKNGNLPDGGNRGMDYFQPDVFKKINTEPNNFNKKPKAESVIKTPDEKESQVCILNILDVCVELGV